MAARIVWLVLTLGILAVFQLSVTQQDYEEEEEDEEEEEEEEEERTCGIQPPENIVGGSPTNEGNWPWQVSLQTKSNDHFCGGVLIDNDWVLTAAHCVHKRFRPNVKDTIAVLGEFDLKQKSGKEQFKGIKDIFVHPKYQPMRFPNDLALIQLENDADLNENVSPICLPSSKDVYPSNSCSITGWGKTKGTEDKSHLGVQKVNILTPDECQKVMPGEVRPELEICVKYGLTGACHGDSGGPISCLRSSDGRFFVAGVASTVDSPCQKLDHPSIYTNIQTFVPWINKITHSTTENP